MKLVLRPSHADQAALADLAARVPAREPLHVDQHFLTLAALRTLQATFKRKPIVTTTQRQLADSYEGQRSGSVHA